MGQEPAGRSRASWRPFASMLTVREQLAPFSPRSGRRVIGLVVLSVLGTLAETVALVLVARAAVAVTAGEDVIELGGVGLTTGRALVVALLALLVKLLLSIWASWVGAVLAARTVRTGRLVLLDAYFGADWETQSRERMGEVQDYLTTSVGKLNDINKSFVSGLNALVSFAVVTAVAIAISPLAALGCAAASGALILLLRPLAYLTRWYSWVQSDATRDLAADVTGSVRLSLEVRVFGVRAALLQQLDAAEEKASSALRSGNFASMVAPTTYQTLALAFLVLAVGAVRLSGGEDVTTLGPAVLLLLRGLNYGQQLQGALQGLSEARPFLDALHTRKRLYLEHQHERGLAPAGTVSGIDVEGVSFSYREGQPVLQDLSFRLGSREAIGVVGPSGSGKSTLLQLLLRLRAPTSGRIGVDGRDLWSISEQAWAGRVAFVPQEARLVDGTVADNIRFYRDLPGDQVEQAARLAHIHDDIASWPDGYLTQVGDSGNRISGGQRQRLAIARALAGGPDLLVLDEPTSALDLLSEARLQETLEGLRGRVGLVVVAHRLSTIKHCDRVLVLRAGRMEAFDRHARLLETSSFYREAVSLTLLQPTQA